MSSKKSKKSKGSKKGKNKETKNVVEFYNGTNTFKLPNGDEYIGDYWAHRSGSIWREGEGIYHTKDNQTYEGRWKDDKLMDGTPVMITYYDGTTFKGSLLKNKYKGPGTYILRNGMEIHGQFENNKFKDDLILVDFDGRLWHGVAKEKKAYLEPENIFYQNVTRWRGKSKNILKLMEPEWKEPDEATLSLITKMSDEDLEKLIFAKSTKTRRNIDYCKSDWYQSFLRYKKLREYILNKFRSHQKLTKSEMNWYRTYAKYKKVTKEKKLPKIEEKVDTTLLDIYYGPDYIKSSVPYKVIYPTNYSDHGVGEEESVQEEQLEYVFNEDYYEECEEWLEESRRSEVEEELTPISIRSAESVGLDTISIYNFLNTIKSDDKDICPVMDVCTRIKCQNQ
ncbi:PREDICTED: uncharacterized protein LOC108557771 [Nicrophorus vespilloides]|uniref:Uncharacterized protein LOC108557771 n=1 Tax=Nicrophorus vespilloides TaxID=110193 RepID=A0ABM1M5R4_NICVS|nr:PREDICTED: uncharacterized protein LOC108557771 [Nicrophorus vespilloides]